MVLDDSEIYIGPSNIKPDKTYGNLYCRDCMTEMENLGDGRWKCSKCKRISIC